jgi:NitT/TauT family transport system substrate-binding protein
MRRATFLRAAAATSGALALRTAPASAQAGPPIRMSAVATETLIEPLYSRECGAFARAGLNVDVQVFASSPSANQAMTGRALDVCVNDPLQLTNAINHGLPYQYFAGGLMHSGDAPTTLLCVAKNGPIASAKDLEGQAIAVPTVLNLASLAVREWMGRRGADPAKARFVELPGAAMAPAVVRGVVGAAMLSEPYVTLSAADTHVLADPYDVVGTRFILNSYYARRDWLEANGDLARRLAAALYDTAQWTRTHPAASLQVLIKYSKVDPDRIAGIRRAAYATSLDPALLRPVIDIGLKYKAIASAVAPSDMIAKL